MRFDRVFNEMIDLGYSDEDAKMICRLEGEYINECNHLIEDIANDDNPESDKRVDRYQRIREYYEQQIAQIDGKYKKDVSVGDIVRDAMGYAGVVTLVDKDDEDDDAKIYVLWGDGSIDVDCTLQDVEWTGQYMNVSMLLNSIARYDKHR